MPVSRMPPELAQALGHDTARGVPVSQLVPDGPADDAGIEMGDVISQVNGEDLETPRDLSMAVAEISPGSTAVLSILRGDEEMEIEVTVALRDAPEPAPPVTETPEDPTPRAQRLGLSLTPLPDAIRRELGIADEFGALVHDVMPGSPAQEAGIQPNDVILEAGAQPVEQPGDIAQAWEQARAEDRTLLMRLMRGGASLFVAISE